VSPRAVLRRPGPSDLDALADNVAEGFDSYRAFAGAGWEPPPREGMRAELDELLPRGYFWCLLAEVDGRTAGHVAIMPATESRWATAEPDVAHLFHIFVRPPFQGSGLAAELLCMAVEEMRARGYAAARLFTPAGQARARRFYEREGWSAAGGPSFATGLGLELVEYRRDVA
jgi:ribosomal protein S18 acetylase RimI-like enzyme